MSEINGQQLPPGWCWTSSELLFDFVTSGSRGWAKYYADNGALFLRMGNLDHDTISLDLADIQRVDPPAGAEGTRTKVEHGDILISITADVGMTGLVPATLEKAFISQHVALARPVRGICPAYLAWYLASASGGQKQFKALQRGATKVGLGLDDITSVRVPIAPLVEQESIVALIDELLSDLDAGVAALKRVQAKLKHYRAAVMKAAVEGTLTADWRAKHPDTEPAAELLQRILTERRRLWEEAQLRKLSSAGAPPLENWKLKYQEPVPPDVTNLPALPQGWVWASAEQLTGFITKGTTPPGNEAPRPLGEVPFIKVQHLSGTGDFHFEESPAFVSRTTHETFLSRSKVVPGDVLMNIVGPPLGQVSIVPADYPEWNINQAIAIFRPLGGISPKFVATCLLARSVLSRALSQTKTTAGQVNLTLEVCRGLPIPLPPLQEQLAFVEAAEDQLSLIDHLEADLEAKVISTQALRQSILRHAFTGQLVPQDPSDEPATELIKSIIAERKERTRQAAVAKQATKKAKPAKTKPKTPRRRPPAQEIKSAEAEPKTPRRRTAAQSL
ncbi:restriction endonuclease subunit S [Bradyrhizobium sp. AUGA SZCCT0042]|uniref:restriction endonuclease subunit S n=1 Tax=Bradyrhizobium sp. AUGA SZCCT0042 TaxID=2807651 RepID=UPI001BA86447|nr:restriction endonuclease subunit S [Bradyrhizobium sp. AUGA SZCCT0042]MBR1300063.1 restriction endonuclease subunit S [Bradyrhizobium sp. AUGA SZCCT0042]